MKSFKPFNALIIALVYLFTTNLLAQNTSTLTQVRLNINSNESNDRRLTSTNTENKINRELFGNSYACIPIGMVGGGVTWDMMVTTDPLWNRLVYGDYNKWIKSYGSWGFGIGQFRHPHGIDRSANGVIFVADTGNNRVVVLKMQFLHNGSGNTSSTYISYVTSITGLSLPYDVAWDDNGTTTDTDDYLWVADNGNHRIIKYRFYANNTFSAQKIYGSYGTGNGQFRHPKAIAVGRTDGLNDNNIYVADTGNQRIVRLENTGPNTISWKNTYVGSLVGYSSVESDWYGGVWVTDKKNHKIIKLDRYLNYLHSYGSYGPGQVYGNLNNPTDYSIYFTAQPEPFNLSNYTWIQQNITFASERWGDGSGGVCYTMGTSIKYANATPLACPPPGPFIGNNENRDVGPLRPPPTICSASLSYKITDYSKASIWVYNTSGQLFRTLLNNQVKTFGSHTSFWNGKDDNGIPVPIGNYYFRVKAVSLYTGSSPVYKNSGSFFLDGYINKKAADLASEEIPKEFALSRNYPNPFNPSTKINFQVPKVTKVIIKIYDILGREIRILIDERKSTGTYQVTWDGRDDSGQQVASGLYIYRMEAGDLSSGSEQSFVANRKMLLLK